MGRCSIGAIFSTLTVEHIYFKTVYTYGVTQVTVPYHSVLCLVYFTVKRNVVEIELVKYMDRLI